MPKRIDKVPKTKVWMPHNRLYLNRTNLDQQSNSTRYNGPLHLKPRRLLTKKKRKNELQTLEEIPKIQEILLYINPITKPKSF